MGNIREVIKLMRPLQWVKNAFVFAGVIFGMRFTNSELLLKVVEAAIAFCFISSCVYVINDIVDRDSDRHHIKKKNRPIAKGAVSVPFAIGLAAFLGISGLLIAYSVSPMVLLIVFLYLLLNLAYSYKLKHVVIIDVFCISAGFMLRLLAGTIGVGIPPSRWLLLCGMLVTLFLGFVKRRAELIALKRQAEDHRKVLTKYSPLVLDEIIGICATGVIITYSLYSMSPETIAIHKTENLIYTVPFLIYAIFRYIYLLHIHTGGGDPSQDIFKDRHIVASVVGWALLTFYLFRSI